MKGVLLSQAPGVVLTDVSHCIPAFDLEAAAYVIWAGTRHFPSSAVHLAVVDPGVGTARRALAMEAGGSFLVGPDNGIFDRVLEERALVQAVALRRPEGSSLTFEGRDVFAPAAAALARGDSLVSLGEPAGEPVHLPPRGPSVIWIDEFGNLITNLRSAPGGVRVRGQEVRLVARTFSDVGRGELLSYRGSMGLVEVGCREGRADLALGARRGDPVEPL